MEMSPESLETHGVNVSRQSIHRNTVLKPPDSLEAVVVKTTK